MMRKKNIWIIVLFILLGVVAFFVAGRGNNKEKTDVSLYFIDKASYVITPVETEIEASSRDELYDAVARELIKGHENKKYLPIMSKDVKVNSIKYEEGNIAVDFSGEYQKDNYMCTYAVIKSFSRLQGVMGVKVTVNGDEIYGTDGMAIGFVSGDDINTESAEDTATGIRLYFKNIEKNELSMEYRKINIVDTQSIEQYVVTELIKGPKIKGNERVLASDTKILSVETTDGICYVNFKKGFAEKNMLPPGGTGLLVESVVKSLTALKNVDGVQFLVEGKKIERLGDTDISGIFEKEKPVEVVIPETEEQTETDPEIQTEDLNN